jgi:hypothetical protein
MAKEKKKESIGSKIMSGIKSAGAQIKSDFKHATDKNYGTKASRADYRERTDNTKAINKAIASGNEATNALIEKRPDLASRIKRESMMSRMGGASDNSGIASLKNTTDAQAQADQYAENLRRYNEYMQGQNALTVMPQQPAVTPEMRQAALQTFESQRGAGQMPYYMAAAANSQAPDMSPAFQYAAQNYATLGGSQRLGPRPMEMMSVAERRQINDMAQAMADQQAQQMDYQRGMDMIMRGGGKGGGATMPQTGGGMPRPPLPFAYGQPSPFASMLSQRFGGFGRY